MEQKIAQFINKGMQQDYSISKSSNEFAFKNHNIRITTRGENSLLTVTNEKSNKEILMGWEISITKEGSKYDDTYSKVIFDTPKILSKIELECKVIQKDSPTTKDITLEIFFDGDEYYDFLFENYISDYYSEYRIIDVYIMRIYSDLDEAPEVFDNPTVNNGHIGLGYYTSIKGRVLGYCVTNDYIVLFTKENNIDYIISVDINSNSYNILYSGNLGFSLDNPIETLYNYESENVEKIYWVDGINRPRLLNVKGNIQENNDSQFDFNPIALPPKVTIEKQNDGKGEFKSGTIQYVITYCNNFMQESAPAYISPLYYLSGLDKGGSVEDTVSCSFSISIEDVDTNWDTIKLYSIVRASDATALGYLVGEKKVNDSVLFNDDGIGNEAVDATNFLFKNSDFVAGTISKKGDQLFLGNIRTLGSDSLDGSIEEKIRRECSLTWTNKALKTKPEDSNVLYSYDNQLTYSESDIKGFKYNETYRFALQLQNNRGIWSEPIYLRDITNTLYPTKSSIPTVKATLNWSAIKNAITTDEIQAARLLRAELGVNRKVVAQGIVSPCVYNIAERAGKTCHSATSWVQRFTNIDGHLCNVDAKYGSDKNIYYRNELPRDGEINKFDVKDLEETINAPSNSTNDVSKAYISNITYEFHYFTSQYPKTITLQIRSIKFKAEFYNKNDRMVDTVDFAIPSLAFYLKQIEDIPKKLKNVKAAAKNAYNAYLLPERLLGITYNQDVQDVYGNELGVLYNLLVETMSAKYSSVTKIENINKEDIIFSNVSLLPITNDEYAQLYYDYKSNDFDKTVFDAIHNNTEKTEVTIAAPTINNISGTQSIVKGSRQNEYYTDASIVSFHSPENIILNEDYKFRIVGIAKLNNNISSCTISVNSDSAKGYATEYSYNAFTKDNKNLLYSHFLWSASNNTLPLINMWHKSGSLSNIDNEDILKHKVIGNLWYCSSTSYVPYSSVWEGNGISNLKYCDNNQVALGVNVHGGSYNRTIIPYESAFKNFYVDGSGNIPQKDVEETKLKEKTGGKIEACNIKYSTTPHHVFTLNKNKDNGAVILPGYKPSYSKYNRPVTYSNGESLEKIESGTFDKMYIYPFIVSNTNYINRKIHIGDGQYIEGESSRSIPFVSDAYATLIVYDRTKVLEALNATVIQNKYSEILEHSDILPYVSGNTLSPGASVVIQAVLNNIIKIQTVKLISKSGEYWTYNVPVSVGGSITTIDAFIEAQSGNLYTMVGGDIKGITENNPNYVRSGVGKFEKYSYLGYNIPLCIKHLKKTIPYIDNSSTWQSSALKNKSVLIGEFYRELEDQYGNPASTQYVICSKTYTEEDEKNGYITITDTYGDTYYQRWDCLRTYPTTEEDINSVVDVVSVMIESYTNLDGRYDSNRGRLDVHNIRPTNINLINSAYTQNGNFFSAYDLDDRLKVSNLENCYTWSLKKSNNELTDSWTKGLLVNINALDGAKGKLTKLQLWKDFLLAFQETGIARIHYNDQTTLGSLEGVPVEIANSNKVQGHNYLSEAVGCHNKWTILPTESGIYFVDSVNRSINIFNGSVVNLSYNKSFKDWGTNNITSEIWSPNNSNAFRASFDFKNRDYYLTNDTACLCFSEELQAFSSFYDYTESPIMFNFKDKFIGIQSSNEQTRMWEQFAGDDYCSFYGNLKDYSVEFNINPNPLNDKIFTNLEYRAYVDNSDDTFDNIEVSNEYQCGESNPNIGRHKYPNAEKKFRIWRMDVPRDKNSRKGLDRIRSPWMKLKLTKNNNTNNRMNFHDLLVRYYE